jgi:hypothetical protein
MENEMSQRAFNRERQKQKKAKPSTPSVPDHQPSIQAMVWYRKEEWETLKEMFVDGDKLPVTYEDWLSRAEQMKNEVQAAGDAVIKVYIDPETFPDWCKKKGLEMNSEARSQMAIEVAQAQSFSL